MRWHLLHLATALSTAAAALVPPPTQRPPESPPAPSGATGRRALISGAIATAAAAIAPLPASASFEGADWKLWPALPLAPYGKRKTIKREAVPGRVWTFEQLLGVFYVHVPIRMTVVRMDSGGLFVYAPVAPTDECLSLLQPLIDAYGPVRFVVLPSVAPEHKVLAGPFAKKFPRAQFYTTDRQYSFPFNLPTAALGFPGVVTPLPTSSKEYAAAGAKAPLFDGEFDFEVLSAKASSQSIYQDAAFVHKPSKTLLLCDALISATAEPPPILLSEPEYRRALLYHARDDPLEKVADTPEVRRKGWKRIALFANFFMPGSLVMLPDDVWLNAAPKTPMPELGWGGVLPFTWRASTEKAFDAFAADGAPAVAPIIQIIMSRQIPSTQAWVDTIASWDFTQVVPAHFDAPISMSPKQFASTFAFLKGEANTVRFCAEDVQFLNEAIEGLDQGPPDLALYKTPLGPLKGKQCGLL